MKSLTLFSTFFTLASKKNNEKIAAGQLCEELRIPLPPPDRNQGILERVGQKVPRATPGCVHARAEQDSGIDSGVVSDSVQVLAIQGGSGPYQRYAPTFVIQGIPVPSTQGRFSFGAEPC